MRVEEDGYWETEQRMPDLADRIGDAPEPVQPYNGPDDTRKPGRHALREIVETVLVTLLIFFLVRAVIQNFKVEGDSMLPTLHNEQYLLVNKILYYRYDA